MDFSLSLTALHPDSIGTLKVEVGGETAVEEWEATPGSAELQEIPGLEGLVGTDLEITGVMEEGQYFAILEVRAVYKIFLRYILKARPSLHVAYRSNPIVLGYVGGMSFLRLQVEGCGLLKRCINHYETFYV